MQVLFVQGGGEGVHDEWDNKLVASLRQELRQDYQITIRECRAKDDPSYALWKTQMILGKSQRQSYRLKHDAKARHLVGTRTYQGFVR